MPMVGISESVGDLWSLEGSNFRQQRNANRGCVRRFSEIKWKGLGANESRSFYFHNSFLWLMVIVDRNNFITYFCDLSSHLRYPLICRNLWKTDLFHLWIKAWSGIVRSIIIGFLKVFLRSLGMQLFFSEINRRIMEPAYYLERYDGWKPWVDCAQVLGSWA